MVAIMVVDNEPDILVLARMMLEREGYEVMEVGSGEECLRQLDDGARPDLILLDAVMPGLNGWEVCVKIKADRNLEGIPVVMFTVERSARSVERSRECGADAHIVKPFDMDELLSMVRRLV